MRRQIFRPFWVEQQLVLRPQYLRLATLVLQESDQESDTKSYIMEHGLRDMEEDFEELDYSEDKNPKATATRIKSTLDSVKDLEDEKEEIGNSEFLKKVEGANSKDVALVDEIDQQEHQRTMPMTWISNRYAAMTCYKPLNRTLVRKLYSEIRRF